ncbi:hypothetical protein FQR65_LT10773 [Abscondita terminalis]|nr:hypothetical protein FQR65_LT10773 [Abscondita terminalis]
MNRNSRKREFRRPNAPHYFKKPKRQSEKFEIVQRVKSQKGVRSQIVFTHGEFNIEPMSVLRNALDRINATLNVKNMGTAKDGQKFALYINNENIIEGIYLTLDLAKKELAKLAVDELKNTCFTIFRKIRPRDSPTVDVNPNSSTSSETPPPQIGGIGAKMLLKMGWAGGGLGSQGQGTTEIVKVSNQIDRQGFGTEHTLPVDEIKSVLQNYASSDDINSISFSPDFTKEERAVIHSVANTLHLKSSSYGSGADRRLVIQKKINPWQLVNSLLEIGGENEQYRLILPEKFVKK